MNLKFYAKINEYDWYERQVVYRKFKFENSNLAYKFKWEEKNRRLEQFYSKRAVFALSLLYGANTLICSAEKIKNKVGGFCNSYLENHPTICDIKFDEKGEFYSRDEYIGEFIENELKFIWAIEPDKIKHRLIIDHLNFTYDWESFKMNILQKCLNHSYKNLFRNYS